MDRIEVDAQEQTNVVFATAVAALAGVAELAKEARGVIGDEAADRVAEVMLARLGDFPIPTAVRDALAKEVRDRSR